MDKMTGESWITTTFDALEDWAPRNSFWPFPFGTACCAIEFMSTVSSHYDLSRFGSEVVRFSPRQSDVLLVAGHHQRQDGPGPEEDLRPDGRSPSGSSRWAPAPARAASTAPTT